LIPSLIKTYNVHVFDIAPRPSSLPISPSLTYHKGSIDPSSPALSKVFAKTRIGGIIHLAGISLEEWCLSRLEACEKVNLGGTRALLEEVRKSRKGIKPWMVLASSIDVFGQEGPRNGRHPITSIGKTKLAAELIVEEATEAESNLRTAIVRMDEIYGYPNSGSIASAFIPSLVTNALTGLPIQYSSTRLARDYVHIDDALKGWLEIIEKVRIAEVGEGVGYHDLISGTLTTESEVVDIVRRQTDTVSPIRDIGTGSRPSSNTASRRIEHSWKPTISLETGHIRTITDLISANEKYNLAYLSNNCPSSPLSSSPAYIHRTHPADERNKDLTKLDGCTVNLGFNHAGFLHHLKCEDGKHCLVDGIKVPSYNWNQSVFIIHKVPSRKEERRVRVRLEEEKGMGWLGFSRTSGLEVGLELYGKNEVGVETTFDLQVSYIVANEV
jgi:nucleoside-diphosphate-sugar epimerase